MGKKDLSRVIDVKADVSLKPMLLEFEHGTLRKEEVPKLDCEFLINSRNTKDIRMILNSDNAAYRFRGQKLDSDSQDSQLCQRFFVIRNKKTNKVRLASVEQLIVSRYLENVQKYDKLNSSKITISDDKVENLKELNKAFGSKRSQRSLDLNSKMKINKEAVETNMEETVIGVDLDDSELNSKPESECDLLPKCNRNAESVHEVYKLTDLFTSSEVLDSLTEVAESVLDQCPEEPNSHYSKFFIDAMKIVPSISVDKVKCLVYADALLKFMSIQARKLNNKTLIFNICPQSKQIRNIIINDFTMYSKSGRTRPLSMRDKAVCYVLVLLMIVFDYKLDQEYIRPILGNISPKKLLQIGKAVGFSSVFGQNKWILKLPLPSLVTPSKRKSGW